MVKKKKTINNQQPERKLNGVWWKILIVFTFIISVICLLLLIFNKCDIPPKYKYETKIIELNNDNEALYADVVDYLCDEGVYVNHIPSMDYIYMCTWVGCRGVKQQYKGMNGKCMIKIRERVE